MKEATKKLEIISPVDAVLDKANKNIEKIPNGRFELFSW